MRPVVGTQLGRRGQKVQIQPLLFSICMLVGLCLSFPSVSWEMGLSHDTSSFCDLEGRVGHRNKICEAVCEAA